MNTSKRRFVLAGIISFSLLAASCGDDETTTTTAAPTTEASGGTTTEGSGEPGTTEPATTAPASNLSGEISIDGSSTVAPLMKLTAEDFQDANGGVTVAVGTSGTGGGFEKFCNGETDISNASRAIKDEEVAACEGNGIEFIELIIANDALSVVVNPANDWATCLTVEQLNLMWAPEAEGTINNWNQIDPSFPDQALTLFGAGTDSGTFDYFTKEINGEEGASRTDYNPTEDDNVTVTGVNGDAGALGYFGYSYLEENLDSVKAVEIDGGEGCVAPSAENVQNGTYTPLARPLYIYISTDSATRAEVKAFVQFYVDNQDAIATEALFVALDDEQKATQAEELASLLAS
ncbi:MAG: PstS family phosphate ABC transporter substrate-binding protein [Actinomycetota bacterium]|nr:PstS family phosphate ABC transporter substrate-binding protein [Actinomycetota bacterium]